MLCDTINSSVAAGIRALVDSSTMALTPKGHGGGRIGGEDLHGGEAGGKWWWWRREVCIVTSGGGIIL